MRFTYLSILSFAALTGVSACGDNLGEQAIIGAGAGAGTALVLDGNVAGGALVGAAGNVAYCNLSPNNC